jgi:GST-like protein
MIKFYFNAAPNPMKVALLLEELGVAYEPIPVDTRKGEQHKDEFTKLNPNAKVPCIVDNGCPIFDSNAILLYLADKSSKFTVTDLGSPKRGQMLAWLMFIATGIGPYSGQSVHFRHAAPEPKEYALNRYDFEAHRHWKILDDHLKHNTYMLGEEYTIVDMAFWGWVRMVPFVLGMDNAWEIYPNLKRLLDDINKRPAAQKAEALKTKFTFKTDMDAEARKNLFPQNERLSKA